jgi:hypothetical protein
MTSGSALGSRQCRYLTAILAELPWSVELHHYPPDNPVIVIQPSDLDDATGPTLIISSYESCFYISEIHWDAYRRLGDYEEWVDVLRAVQLLLTSEMTFPPM